MIKAEQGGSMYDFVSDDHEAPPQRERTVGQFANRENMSEPYVNREAPKVNPVEVEQKDESSIAFWRMFTGQMPKGAFEQSVNIKFGGREAIGELFREKKIEYVKLYKQIMGEI
jgi:hypothetical protein